MSSLETRRKQIRYLSHHRGMRELDLMLGAYADAFLDAMPATTLACYARLLEWPEADLYAALLGPEELVPQSAEGALLAEIRAFARHGRGALS